jgi:hypothetical protein
MPTISRFYGITIRMDENDHAPPHFHAVYGEEELIVAIDSLAILAGTSRGRFGALVLEWAALHQAELRDNWDRCRQAQPPSSIAPLD